MVVGPDREALARLATAVGAGRVVRHGDGYAYRVVGSSAKFALVMAFPWLPAWVHRPFAQCSAESRPHS